MLVNRAEAFVNLVTRDRPNSTVIAAAVAMVQPTNCDSCIHCEHVIARASSEWFW